MVKPYKKYVWARIMKIEKLGTNVCLEKKRSIPGIFVIIIIECLRGKVHGEFALVKGIFPLLCINDIFDNAFGVKDLSRVEFVRGVSNNS